MPKLRIGHRLMMIVAVAVVGLVVTISLDLVSLRQSMMDDRRMLVKDMVAAAHAVATDYHERVQAGELSASEAQGAAKAAIGAMRYGDGDYLWIHDLEGRMLMHPINAGLVGKNTLALEDANGKRFFAEFNRLVKANGFGFVDYVWPKAGSDTPEPKVSYVQEFGPWDWVIGTGIYVDDVSAAQRAQAKTVNFATLYGQGPFSLAKQLGITREEAKAFIETYFERFKGVRDFLDAQVEAAKEQGVGGDPHGPTSLRAGAEVPELERAPVRGAGGPEHPHPGHRRRHDQEGDDRRPGRPRRGRHRFLGAHQRVYAYRRQPGKRRCRCLYL